MVTDHWPWDALIPVGAALGGYLVKAVQDGLTRRHEDRRRFSSDNAQYSALHMRHAIELRHVIQEEERLGNQLDRMHDEINRAGQAPDAPAQPELVEALKALKVTNELCAERSREHDSQCRASLCVLAMVAPPDVRNTAMALLMATDKDEDEWNECGQAFAASVRKSLGVKGALTHEGSGESRWGSQGGRTRG